MKPITVSTTVEKPIEEVFAFLDVMENHEAFTDHFLVDWNVIDRDHAQVRAATPGGERIDIAVVERRPPVGIVGRTSAAAANRATRGTYALEQISATRTRVLFELVYETTPVADRLVAPLVRMYLRRVSRRAMDRLAALLDSGRG
jgi:uncharacterized membrane protein